MNTKDIAIEYRLAHWTQIIRERSESGLSIRTFCIKAGIHENTYYYWQKKLRETACEQLTMMQSESMQASLIRTGFAEVKLQESRPLISHDEPGNLLIETSGFKITADSTYPTDQLAYLLRELVRQ